MVIKITIFIALAIFSAGCGDEINRYQRSIEILGIFDEQGEQVPGTEIIDPCGPETIHDEVVIRYPDGRLVAYYEGHGDRKDRLTVLVPGVVYTTTDGTNCRFMVTENGEVVEQ